MTKENKSLVPTDKLSLDEIRTKIKGGLITDVEPKKILRDFDDLMTQYKKADKNEAKKMEKQILEITQKAAGIMGLDTHYPVAEIAVEKDRPLILELCNQLVNEYECKTPSEKILVHLIGGSYARTLVISRYLVNTVALNHTTPGLNCFMAVMSKELDRSSRQLISALTVLKQFKAPPLKINIKTNTAFIAQNQQLNNNPSPNENNNP